MSKTQSAIRVDSDSDLGRLLETVVEDDILLEMEGARFRLYRLDAAESPVADHPQLGSASDRILNIIGLGASKHGSDVARSKDEYVAEAADRKG